MKHGACQNHSGFHLCSDTAKGHAPWAITQRLRCSQCVEFGSMRRAGEVFYLRDLILATAIITGLRLARDPRAALPQ